MFPISLTIRNEFQLQTLIKCLENELQTMDEQFKYLKHEMSTQMRGIYFTNRSQVEDMLLSLENSLYGVPYGTVKNTQRVSV